MTRELSASSLSLVLLAALAIAIPASVQAQDDTVEPDVSEVAPTAVDPVPVPPTPPPTGSERLCTDGMDEDGDGMVDCADADCFDADACVAGGREERTDAACGDWIDNDGDGAVDCDDEECHLDFLHACRGSWTGAGSGSVSSDPSVSTGASDDLPELGAGQSVEDLIGTAGDNDGERSDEVCSDGIDNDVDGRTDCADFGCRFDPQVSVCQGTPGLRFSVVAGIGARIQFNFNAMGDYLNNRPDAGFTLLQLRALGPIPFINNSFFLINLRVEESVRLTFAMFQIPITNMGHYININSGFGGLSTGLIISAARQPLLDPPFYLFNAFEQGNGAALEVGGPIDAGGILRFRVYGAGGSGLATGNVGGSGFSSATDRNFTWAIGGQLSLDVIGHTNRFDSAYLYTPVPLALNFQAGAKYDQRANERFVAWNAQALFRFWHFLLRAESYSRHVLDYDSTQTAWNVQLSVLLAPRVLMAAADVGGFYRLSDYNGLPAGTTPDSVRFQPEQFQWRFALHWYYFRNVGILSLMYRELYREHVTSNPNLFDIEREIRLETRFRF
jgi:hypothetical protein